MSGEGVSADPQTGYQPQKSSANASSSYWGPSPKDSSSPPAKWVWVPPSNRPDIVTEAGTYVFVARGANEASGSGGGRVGRPWRARVFAVRPGQDAELPVGGVDAGSVEDALGVLGLGEVGVFAEGAAEGLAALPSTTIDYGPRRHRQRRRQW